MSRTTPEPDPLDRELREAFRRTDLPAAPLDLRAEIEALPSSPRRARGVAGGARFGWWPRSSALLGLVAAAVAIAVVVAGLPILLTQSQGGHESPTASQSMPLASPRLSPSSEPATSAGTGAPYSMGSFAWQEVGIGTFDGVEDLALFPVDQGLLVLGTSRTAQARLWLSSDGLTFQPLDASAFASGDPARQMVGMTGLVKGPAGYLAVGRQVLPMSESTKAEVPSPLVWRSADGLHWSRLDPKGLPQSGIRSIAATSNGYVVALDGAFSDPSIGPFSAYTSTDGTSWQATSVVAMDVVAHAGHVVAVTSDGAVAVTDDGANWTTLHPAKQVVTIEAGPDGFVGITYDQANTHMSVIRSADARTWTTAGNTTGNWTNGMVYAMGRWVTLGASPGGPVPWAPIITSPDGVIWQSTAIPYEVLTKSLTGGVSFHPFGDGLFAETQAEIGPGDMVSYGPLQVHLWFVRAARAGDTPGSTVPPEPTVPPPVATPSDGITEARAIEIASALYPVTMTKPYGKLVPIGGMDPKETLVPADTLVWAVTVLVPKPACSGKAPGSSPCELPYGSLTVMVDYYSGDVIEVVDNFLQAAPDSARRSGK
jgi:hypothetical protein